MKPTPLLGLLLLCTGCAGLVHAEEWPQWRGLHRDGRSPETQLLKQWPAEGPPLLWQTEGVGEGHASLAV
ncbi:MAG: polyvinylalcohol dehydrogenase, partial [Candidatus Hydrogenedentes bacterium]|nr:polyvinylalcohol dehydrogenase [Candidatus Hydrogenedentota bacterium]